MNQNDVASPTDPLSCFRNGSPEHGAFVARLALKPTLVLTSNRMVRAFLEETDPDHFYNGLKDFFFGLFGPRDGEKGADDEGILDFHFVQFAQSEIRREAILFIF